MVQGTPSSSMPMLGSPVITVRAEKSTRLPMRLPRMRPDLPFSLCSSTPVINRATQKTRCVEAPQVLLLQLHFATKSVIQTGPTKAVRMGTSF